MIKRVSILTLLGIAVGGVVGVLAVAFVEAVLWLNDMLLISRASRAAAVDSTLLTALTILVPTAGGLVIGLIATLLPDERFHGPQDAIRTAQSLDAKMPVRNGVLSTAAACLSLGSGASVGQYGPRAGVPRILDLLERYEIPSTFFIPAVSAQIYADETRAVAAAGHEIGIHGWIHELNSVLPYEAERDLLFRAEHAPIVDLNSTGSEGDLDRDFAVTYTEDDPAVAVTDSDAAANTVSCTTCLSSRTLPRQLRSCRAARAASENSRTGTPSAAEVRLLKCAARINTSSPRSRATCTTLLPTKPVPPVSQSLTRARRALRALWPPRRTPRPGGRGPRRRRMPPRAPW